MVIASFANSCLDQQGNFVCYLGFNTQGPLDETSRLNIRNP